MWLTSLDDFRNWLIHTAPVERSNAFRERVLLRDYPNWMEENRQPFFVRETSRQMQEWVRSMMLRTSMKALTECSRSVMTTDFRAELPRIVVPALFVHGDKDVSAPSDVTARPASTLIPGARLELYAGAARTVFDAHGAADERHSRVCALMTRWMPCSTRAYRSLRRYLRQLNPAVSEALSVYRQAYRERRLRARSFHLTVTHVLIVMTIK